MLQIASEGLAKFTIRPLSLLPHRGRATLSTLGLPLQLRTLKGVKTMAVGGSYDRELKEACKAVRLASQLCRVRNHNIGSAWRNAHGMHHLHLFVAVECVAQAFSELARADRSVCRKFSNS
jgi:hypothetical protein